MIFKNGVKNIQAAANNGARTVLKIGNLFESMREKYIKKVPLHFDNWQNLILSFKFASCNGY